MAAIVRIEQGSPHWQEHRRKHRNASETPAVLGVSPWQTPYQLWMQRTGKALPPPPTPAMAIVRRFPRSKRRTTRQLLQKSPPLGRFFRQLPEVDEKELSSRCFLLHRKVLELRHFPPLTWFGGPSQAP